MDELDDMSLIVVHQYVGSRHWAHYLQWATTGNFPCRRGCWNAKRRQFIAASGSRLVLLIELFGRHRLRIARCRRGPPNPLLQVHRTGSNRAQAHDGSHVRVFRSVRTRRMAASISRFQKKPEGLRIRTPFRGFSRTAAKQRSCRPLLTDGLCALPFFDRDSTMFLTLLTFFGPLIPRYTHTAFVAESRSVCVRLLSLGGLRAVVGTYLPMSDVLFLMSNFVVPHVIIHMRNFHFPMSKGE